VNVALRPLRHGIRRLSGRDYWEVLGFLRQAPAHNAFLLGQIVRQALDRESVAGVFAGFWDEGHLEGVVAVGSNLVLSEPCSDNALAAFAAFAAHSEYLIRVAVGSDGELARFMARLGDRAAAVAVERPHQVLFRLERGDHEPVAPWPELRPADVSELEALIRFDLEMVDEELGFDPFSRDMPSFRRGWLRRIREQRTWVVGPAGEPVRFKVDHSAVSDDVIQLAGVYTRPEARGQGIATRALATMCQLLLDEVPVISLYVHEANGPAIRLYERLGFRPVGRVRSVWFR